ncbi:hypothetical protein [Nocardioides aurantiacus]|uniref:Uncharacterized protein n=1 Tax=Nocardioides aurantiacus TaxID=86796 RepID=A0A3N2CZL5_9ACTN|nr:hypothetical protein [Nocardioides aurantiacus]ROR92936.1 hypothetical protein EDD33_3838 [Nocardioides aurantiacus]
MVGTTIGAIGVLLVVVPFLAPDAGDPLLLPALGVAMLAAAAAMEIGALALPRPAKAVSTEDSPASAASSVGVAGAGGPVLRIRMRTTVPWSVALVGVGFTVFFVTAALGMGLDGGGLFLLPFVLLFASLIPDAVMTLLRRRALLVDPQGARLEGWGVSAALAWDDVTHVDLQTEGRRPAVLVHGRDDAPSWRHHRIRIIWPTEPRPTRATLAVPVVALDAPGAVMVLCRELAASTLERRRSFLAHGATGLLTGDRSLV